MCPVSCKLLSTERCTVCAIPGVWTFFWTIVSTSTASKAMQMTANQMSVGLHFRPPACCLIAHTCPPGGGPLLSLLPLLPAGTVPVTLWACRSPTGLPGQTACIEHRRNPPSLPAVVAFLYANCPSLRSFIKTLRDRIYNLHVRFSSPSGPAHAGLSSPTTDTCCAP